METLSPAHRVEERVEEHAEQPAVSPPAADVPPVAISKLSREDEAKLALEHTRISAAVARGLSLLFLLTIFSVPVIQHVVEGRPTLSIKRDDANAGTRTEVLLHGVLPQIYDIFAVLPSRERVTTVHSPEEAWELLPQAQQLHQYEDALEDHSVVARRVLPEAQNLLTQAGVGNEQAYVGRDRWLMYRPDVDYLMSRGFLDPALLRVRARSGDETEAAVQPDPIPAIVRFKEQLAERGIQLIVMPTPLKPMVHPEKFSARYETQSGPLQNPSYRAFQESLLQEGVLLCDVTGKLIEARNGGATQFLETDTHWTPNAMALAATELAGFLRQHVELPPVEPPGYTRRGVLVSNLGDIATMLKLPSHQRLFPPQQVEVQQVATAQGELWRPSREADILLLGDSFSNIFSRAALNWGESAGLAEQLSFRLQRPLDVIAINAGGASATRRQLRDDLLRGSNRLEGKRVVIWQFAMRDLMSGDWKLLDLPPVSGSLAPADELHAIAAAPAPAALRETVAAANPDLSTRFRSELFTRAKRFEKAGSRVFPGQNGWLFYLPDVSYIAGQGFLRGKEPPQIKALVDFKRQLAQRGIELLVLPAPAKTTLYPEQLGLNLPLPRAPQNPSFDTFCRALEAQGITVFDPTETLLEQKGQGGAPLFMQTDSHWSFHAMDNVAATLAQIVKDRGLLPARARTEYTRRPVPVKNITDISLLLKPTEKGKSFIRERQTIQQVRTPDGELWKVSNDADVLVMGDSYTNIYSRGGYWGKAGGLAEQLSYHLGRPVDLIAIDSGGVNRTRKRLVWDMLHGKDRLAGKKLVIYEFGVRYLLSNNWNIIRLPQPKPVVAPVPNAVSTPIAPAKTLLVRAQVKQRVAVPAPATTPYKDMVMTLRLSGTQQVLNGKLRPLPNKDIVVYLWAMRDHVLTPASGWKVGQTVTLKLTPWQSVEEKYGGYDRVDLEGDDVARLDAYWGEPGGS